MLLKPATPLTILLLAAFALLLISVISTPIVRGIPLAAYKNFDYGVFGYCKGNQCTNAHVGYSTSDLASTSGTDDFDLPSNARKSLSSILIVHPVAAFLTFVCLCMAAAAHFHAPSHSPRFLLALLILLLPTLLVTLLAFLVDILLFVPHLRWGGWIVLAATIILVTCGVLTCAMRRTLVSRKARKRRIAENAEMSGENYYNRQHAAAAAAGLTTDKPGGPMSTDVKESFVTTSTAESLRPSTRGSDDERTPLNTRITPPGDAPDVPPLPGPRFAPNGSPTGQRYNGSGDQAANPTIPPIAYGPPPGMRQMRPDQRPHNHRGAPLGPGPRGRGGYPVRGGYPPRGGFPYRGGYGRGGPYGGPRGPPPNGRLMRGGPMRGSRRPPPPPLGYPQGPGGLDRSVDSYDSGSLPSEHGQNPRGPSSAFPTQHPPDSPIGMAVLPDEGSIGQAIEMTPQTREPAPPHSLPVNERPLSPESPSSLYSRSEAYVPPRDGWRRDTPSIAESEPLQMNFGPQRTGSKPNTNYYEDLDPRFMDRQEQGPSSPLPSALVPGSSAKPVTSPPYPNAL